jgi:hypothetical protein
LHLLVLQDVEHLLRPGLIPVERHVPPLRQRHGDDDEHHRSEEEDHHSQPSKAPLLGACRRETHPEAVHNHHGHPAADKGEQRAPKVGRPLDEQDWAALLIGDLILLVDREVLLAQEEDVPVEHLIGLRLRCQGALTRLVYRAALRTFDELTGVLVLERIGVAATAADDDGHGWLQGSLCDDGTSA